MNSLGSLQNRHVFVLADDQLNCIKSNVFSRVQATRRNVISEGYLNELVEVRDELNADVLLTNMRNVISIFSYINHPIVHGAATRVMMEFRRELRIAEEAHSVFYGRKIRLVASFDAYIPSYYNLIAADMRYFVRTWLGRLEALWATDQTAAGATIRNEITIIRNHVNAAAIDQNGFYNPV
ncbi:hypothetical protein PT974_10274 [Cladobotryum mycophilum]|uniref:Uncharacterized protein n=1 Tax=Cladobotryum mycophilum TaxID=491253 RepID=A0ABR0S9D4_9HYPO